MKFAYKYKKLTAMLLSIILFVNMLSVYALAEDSSLSEVAMDDTLRTSAEVENVYNKIHFYVGDEDRAVIDEMTELKAATAELAEVSSNASAYAARTGMAEEEYQITIQFASNYMETDEYKAFEKERSELDSIEEVRAFRSRVNAFSKEYHEELVRKNMASLSVLEYKEVRVVEYSPFVVATVDPTTIDAEILASFAASESVANISVAQEAMPETEISWNDTLKEIDAYDIVSNETYTGEGLRIGIYEAAGICDVTHTNLVGKSITVRNASQPLDTHATMVTSILTTIAPEADYYVANILEDDVGIEWFLGEECDIINCSFGYNYNTKNDDGTYSEGPRGYRYDVDAVYDYQIRANFVIVVKSAGNVISNAYSSGYNPQGKITSPGYAYNVITVGGVSRRWNLISGNLEHDEDACYVCTSPKIKPNISAIYEVNIPNIGTAQGTSLATPQVAGCIAILMESNIGYCIYPERVMSVITSTAQKTHNYTADVGNFDSKVGAGVIDLQAMLDSNINRITHNESGSGGRELLSIELSLTAGTELNAALAWMANPANTATSGISISTVYVADYDLRIYAPSGELVSSALGNSNYELVRLTTGETGTYRIVLYQYTAKSNVSGEDWIVLTYNF